MDDSPRAIAERLTGYVDELLAARETRNALAVRGRTQLISAHWRSCVQLISSRPCRMTLYRASNGTRPALKLICPAHPRTIRMSAAEQ